MERSLHYADLHLDCPASNLPEQTPDCCDWLNMWKQLSAGPYSEVKWMLITLVAPEFLVGRAFQDFIMARKSRDQMRKFVKQTALDGL